MRLYAVFLLALLFCGLCSRFDVSVVMADEGAAESTIRLTSFTEPAKSEAIRNAAERQPAQNNEQAAASQSASQAEEDPSPAPTGSAAAPAPAAIAPSVALAPPVAAAPSVAGAPPIVNRPRMPVGLYPNAAAREMISRMPGPMPVVQAAYQTPATRRDGKPFQAVQRQPAVSPYLYLNMTTFNAGKSNANTAMNYYAFVRPQIDQMEASRQKQRPAQQRRTQLQAVPTNAAAPSEPSGTPNMSAHFMDTAQFYRGLQR
jgi:hypothetical protein